MSAKLILVSAALLVMASGVLAQPAAAPKPAASAAGAKAPAPKVLMVGDEAPAMTIEKWVKGEHVTGYEKGKVYLVEFWATWCAPCVASMPHLSDLQKEYKGKGLTVVGVTSADTSNPLSKVEAMVTDKGDSMAYTVAWDTQRKTIEAFLGAARVNYIPCAFLVDQNGKIAYIGHPMGLDQPVEKVMAGTFDLKGASDKYRQEMAEQLAQEERAGRGGSQRQKLSEAVDREDWASAIAIADEMMAKDPDTTRRLAGSKFEWLLTGLRDPAKAYAWGNQVVEGAGKDDSQLLNELAWAVVDPEKKVANPDLDFAFKAASRASTVSKERSGAILDTLARVYFLKGQIAKAVEVQTKAVGVSNEQIKEELQKTLDSYKAAMPK